MADILNFMSPSMVTPENKGAVASEGISSVRQLALSGGRKIYVVERDSEPFLIGRNIKCNLQIGGKYASRIHAYVEERGSGLFLVDMSTHGTFVHSNEWGAFHLKGTDMLLEGEGTVSLGVSIDYNDPALIRYKTE